MLPAITRMGAAHGPAVVVAALLATASLLAPESRSQPVTTESKADSVPAPRGAGQDASDPAPMMQVVPAEGLGVAQSGPVALSGQPRVELTAVPSTEQTLIPASGPGRTAVLVLGTLLTFGLVAAGIALTFGQLRKDTRLRKRRGRRRSRSDSDPTRPAG